MRAVCRGAGRRAGRDRRQLLRAGRPFAAGDPSDRAGAGELGCRALDPRSVRGGQRCGAGGAACGGACGVCRGWSVQARPDELPLSYAQRRLWFLDRLGRRRGYGARPTRSRWRCGCRASSTARRCGALDDLVVRHESLRTVFPERSACRGRRSLARSGAVALAVSAVERGRACRGADRCGGARALTCRASCRCGRSCYALAPDEHVLLLVLHHIAGDGWSLAPAVAGPGGVLRGARRVGEAARLPALPVQYADYTLWQRAVLGRGRCAERAGAAAVVLAAALPGSRTSWSCRSTGRVLRCRATAAAACRCS